MHEKKANRWYSWDNINTAITSQKACFFFFYSENPYIITHDIEDSFGFLQVKTGLVFRGPWMKYYCCKRPELSKWTK